VNKIFRTIIPAMGLSCALFLTIPASAAVVGTLDTGSTGTVTATINSVTFNNDPSAVGGTNFGCTSGSLICDSDVSTGSNLAFAGCASGATLPSGSPPGANGCLFAGEAVDVSSPITALSVPQASFLTFSNNSNLIFSLTGVSTFMNSNCAALLVTQSCVVFPGSPLLLTLEPNNQTEVQLFVSGTASDTGAAGLAAGDPYAGFFSSNITNPLAGAAAGHTAPTPADIQFLFCGTNTVTSASQCSATASITSSQSGSFTASPITNTGTPEPSSMVMVLTGAGLIGIAFRRRRQA
jgi:PEP-CTERM motif